MVALQHKPQIFLIFSCPSQHKMFNGSYSLIEILKIGIETVHLIKSNWLYFEKKINWLWKITKKKFSHAGTWTRAFWVEGSYADHYTTRNITLLEW